MINLFNNTYYLTNLPPSYRLITFIVQSTSKILTCKVYIDPNVITHVDIIFYYNNSMYVRSYALWCYNNHNMPILLNQARAWFLKIDIMRTSVCVCVHVCVCPPPGLLKTIHVK